MNRNYEDLSIEEQAASDAELKAYFEAQPRRTIAFAATAKMDMENILAPSDDINHPNYRGR